MALTLVVLAAGQGSRYGGLKQIDPVGPGGETMLDYALYDAERAGFERVVFVIRRDFEAAFRERMVERFGGKMDLAYAFQSLDALPPGFTPPVGREKPWGTGHAVWCARDEVTDNFAVIDADDFYGVDSYRQLAEFLVPRTAQPKFAIVGFRLANTLSEHGAVSRGVCTTTPEGRLQSIVEQTSIKADEVGPGKKFPADQIVSMNCWGFTPALFSLLDVQWKEFLATNGRELKSEFYLPAAVSGMIARGQAEARVIPTESSWFGITYREDKQRTMTAIEELVGAGIYPPQLWGVRRSH
jgi:NDP-sugar pyrophosphorylase family protein